MKAIILDSSNIGAFYCAKKTKIYLIRCQGKKHFFSKYEKAVSFSARFCPMAKIETSN